MHVKVYLSYNLQTLRISAGKKLATREQTINIVATTRSYTINYVLNYSYLYSVLQPQMIPIALTATCKSAWSAWTHYDRHIV